MTLYNDAKKALVEPEPAAPRVTTGAYAAGTYDAIADAQRRISELEIQRKAVEILLEEQLLAIYEFDKKTPGHPPLLRPESAAWLRGRASFREKEREERDAIAENILRGLSPLHRRYVADYIDQCGIEGL